MNEYNVAIENLVDAVSSDWISIILAILVVLMGIVVFFFVVMTIVDMFLSKDILWGIVEIVALFVGIAVLFSVFYYWNRNRTKAQFALFLVLFSLVVNLYFFIRYANEINAVLNSLY
ncbi:MULTISPECIES: hypothetical protein [unclassified Exiguobacterium]|uniref:hypothetical protein n=1 Tax=unclassified Exiguobacterium TaxID=2644629 RepID=UPI0010394FE5|nr:MULTISPECIES: hypothetical protein [unclassified Exiguobacterium]TCI36393.1 hypothetical protein EVJ29_07880 [Exiguobacterium sp. SH4S7]TCI48441.1 hypothetical protein EVJ31_05275 [Exiguobacterium sp. SH5S32]TCI55329.1 hypothetical protein EVJ25_05265 [Exiguobacterium sp. SH1S4]TCI57630.1 hypothetical protein EVJ24_02355 [Exiguobacterium sp. SH1S21]TCI63341.1 hypothetical protein EVJ21_07510 [Exiguobacterium sp. SH0S2]